MTPFKTEISLKESDSITTVIGLHKAILAHKDEQDAFADTDNTLSISMRYTLKSGNTLARRYTVDASRMKDVLKAADKLGSSEEYIKKVENYTHKVGLHAADGNYIYTGRSDLNIAKEDVRPLLQAYMEDYKVNGFRYYYDLAKRAVSDTTNWDYINNRTGMIDISIDPSFNDSNNVLFDSNEACFNFGKKDKNTLAFLKENGYHKKIMKAEAES